MTIKQAATKAGVSHQAVYKKLKARGIRVESITEKGTGELTAEGEALMVELYPCLKVEETINQESEESKAADVESEVETLRKESTRLQQELSNAVERIKELTDERDFLRKQLDQRQELETLRLQLDVIQASAKVTPALTDGTEKPRRGLLGWLRRGHDGSGKV